MKLVDTLGSQVKTILIREFSDKVVQKLLEKFKQQTSDDDKTILSYIDDFEKYKSSISVDDRNIEKLSYEDLKNIIDPKRLQSRIKEDVKYFKQNTKGQNSSDIANTLRKFYEIESLLPKGKKKKITDYDYLNIVEIVKNNFVKTLATSIAEKWKNDNEGFTEDQIKYYIPALFQIYDRIPPQTKLVSQMSLYELERLVDSLGVSDDVKPVEEDPTKDIDLVYDKNNLKIFAPKSKEQCILLRNGRTWCTSRSGAGNLYYNYRLNQNLTLYYVIDEDLPYNDLNFATVILVDRYGKKRLADKSNSGKYSGSTILPWDEIVSKVPKLKNLEDFFEAKPLSDQETEMLQAIRGVRVGDDVIASFKGDAGKAEIWMEVAGATLSDSQYDSLPENLKKKYISLGFDLSAKQVASSPQPVLEYYNKKKIESIKTKSLNQLTPEDLALLNSPINTKLKESMKSGFIEKISLDKGALKVTDLERSDIGKFITLYGFTDLFDMLPTDLSAIIIAANSGVTYDLPPTIGRFTQLESVKFSHIIKSVPKEICNLTELTFVAFENCKELNSIPLCIVDLPKMQFINLRGTPATLPEELYGVDDDSKPWSDFGDNTFDRNTFFD